MSRGAICAVGQSTEAPPITDGAFFLALNMRSPRHDSRDEDSVMIERHAAAVLAGRILELARLFWKAPAPRRPRRQSADDLSDRLRRDIGLLPDERPAERYPLNWPWQRL